MDFSPVYWPPHPHSPSSSALLPCRGKMVIWGNKAGPCSWKEDIAQRSSELPNGDVVQELRRGTGKAKYEKILKVVPRRSNLVTIVCMYVCMYAYVYLCTCMCMYVCLICVLIRSCNNNPIITKSVTAYMHLLHNYYKQLA